MQPEDERGDAVGESYGDHAERAARLEREPHQRDVVQRVAELARRDRQVEAAEVGPAQQRQRTSPGLRLGWQLQLARLIEDRIGHERRSVPMPGLESRCDRHLRADRRRPHARRRLGGRRRGRAGRSSLRRRARADAGRARRVVERAAHGAKRAHLRREHRLRPLRVEADPRGADRGAAAAPAPLARVRRRRSVPGRGRARGDAAARQRACEGQLRRAHRDGRAAARVPEPRRAPVRARARLGRRVGRPRAARAPRAAARRRGSRLVRRRAARRRGRARARGPRARAPRSRRKDCR